MRHREEDLPGIEDAVDGHGPGREAIKNQNDKWGEARQETQVEVVASGIEENGQEAGDAQANADDDDGKISAGDRRARLEARHRRKLRATLAQAPSRKRVEADEAADYAEQPS